jgi:hypothetical protein
MDVFPLVYRCAIAVKPKQPFLDWLKKIDSSHNPTLPELQHDSHLYLVPDYEEVDDIEKAIEKYIKLNYSGIFLNELSAWYLDPKMYPKMGYPMFLDWFEISVHTMIFDTVNQPLEKE